MKFTANLVSGEQLSFSTIKSKVIIGRGTNCDFVIPHEGMSRQHCQIEVVDGEIFVTDLGSTNGVLVNSEKIQPNKRVSYQTFLPLAFGAVQNLDIDLEA